MEREQVVERLRGYFDAHPENVVCAYLIGAAARSLTEAGDVVEVGVLLKDAVRYDGARAEREISDILGTPAAVAVLNCAPPEPRYYMVRDRIVVFLENSTAAAEFEVRVYNEYWDFLHFVREYRARWQVPSGRR